MAKTDIVNVKTLKAGKPDTSSGRGYSLLEALIGLAFASVGVLALMSLGSTAEKEAHSISYAVARDDIAMQIDRALGSDNAWHQTLDLNGSHTTSTLMICAAGAIKASDGFSPVYACPDAGDPSGNGHPTVYPLEIYDGDGNKLSGRGGVVGAASPDDVDHPVYYDSDGAPNCIASATHPCPIQVVSYFSPRCADTLYTTWVTMGANPDFATGAANRKCVSAEYIDVFYRITVTGAPDGLSQLGSLTGYSIKTAFDGQMNPGSNPFPPVAL